MYFALIVTRGRSQYPLAASKSFQSLENKMDRWLVRKNIIVDSTPKITGANTDKPKSNNDTPRQEEAEPVEADPMQIERPVGTVHSLAGDTVVPVKVRGKRKHLQAHLNSAKRRRYNDDYIRYGFTCLMVDGDARPQCVMCTEVLANDSLKPVKMKRHLHTKHPTHIDKTKDFFLRKEQDLRGQKQVLTSQTTTTTKLQAASYEVSDLIAKSKKPHTIGETLILPAAIAMCQAMDNEKIASQLKQVPLSDNTVARRIDEMANDIKIQLIDRIKKSGKFSLQLDESTDISNAAQLLIFVRYCYEGKLLEDMLFCTTLDGTCTGQDIFNKLESKMQEAGLSFDNCVGVCTDGAGAMMGKHKGLKAKIQAVAPHVRFTHCFIHREALASKALDNELSSVLQTVIKIVNVIKARPINTRLFAVMCKEMGSEHESLLLHTEVRWLSRGKVLRRLFEMRDEVRLFLLDIQSPYAESLTDPTFLTNLAYLADIFDRLNGLNMSMQGPNTNIMSLADKVIGFVKKMERWTAQVEKGSVEMFDGLHEFIEENELHLDDGTKTSITNHLRGLIGHFKRYFQEETKENNEWIRLPFIATTTGSNLSSGLQDSLLDLSSDRTLRAAFVSTPLDEFWLSVAGEYPGLSEIALDELIPFASTYLCEATFSSLTCIKNKQRSRLTRVEDELRLSVSSIKPRIQMLCCQHQAHPSH